MRFSYKIKIICGFYLLSLTYFSTEAAGQEFKIIRKSKTYRQRVHGDSLQKMIELKSLMPEIIYDLRYATNNNFTGERLYKKNTHTYLRLPAARALFQVQQELRTVGYGLLVFDAYRPFRVTKRMWELIGDERYVANPAKGSGHNRGLAIDLTIIRLADSSMLAMGTDFDHFTDTAHHDFKNLPEDVLKNRQFLRSVMEKHGFRALATEWWHYSWPNDRNYDVLDLDPGKLD